MIYTLSTPTCRPVRPLSRLATLLVVALIGTALPLHRARADDAKKVVASTAGTPTATGTAARFKGRVEVTMSFVPLRGHGAPIVEVRFKDGTVGRFMVDTGAAFCCMTDTFAHKLHLKGALASVNGQGLSLGSDHGRQSQYVDVDAMDMGGVTLTDAQFVLIRQDEFFRFGDTQVDGLLGENVLSQAALYIDYPQEKLTMLLPGGLSDDEIAELGMGQANRVALRRYSHGKLGVGPDAHEFLTDLRLTSGDHQVSDELIVDTGAPDTSISQAAAKSLGLQAVEKRGASTMGDGSVFASVASVAQVSVGDLSLTDLKVTYPGRDRVSSIPPLLGEDVLSFCQVLFDFPKDRLLLKPVLPPVNASAVTALLKGTHSDFTRLRDIAGSLPAPEYESASQAGAVDDTDDFDEDVQGRIAALRSKLAGNAASDAHVFESIGDAFWAGGDRDRARKSYDQAVALYRMQVAAKPDDAILLSSLAQALTDDEREDEAEQTARKAIALSPHEPQAQIALGWALHAQSVRLLTGETRTVNVSAEQLGPFETLIGKLRAQNLPTDTISHAEALSAQAADCFDRAIKIAPDAPRGYRERAAFRLDRGLGITATVRALHGENVEVLASMFTNDYVDDVQRAADHDPANVAALRRAAQAALEAPIYRNESGIDLREGKLWGSIAATARNRAQTQLDRLRAIAHGHDPKLAAQALETLGYLELEYVGDRPAATADLKRATELDPARVFAAHEFATIMSDDRRYEDIVALFQPQVATPASDSAVKRLWLAFADARLGKWDDAQANADVAVALHPDSFAANLAAAQVNLERIDIDTKLRLERAGACLSVAGKALGVSPSESRRAAYRLARAIYEAMRLAPEKARELALENLKANRSDTAARAILASLSE